MKKNTTSPEVKALDLHKMDEPYYVNHRKYLAEVRKIQKSHMSKTEWNEKDRINKDWEKEWLPFIKYDNQWDWAYMLDLLIYKLELMRTSFKYFCSHVDQEKIIRQIDEAVALGKKIYNREVSDGVTYFQEWHDYHRKNSTPYAYVKVLNPNGTQAEKFGNGELLAKIEMPKDDDFNFKSIWRKNYKSPLDKWLQKNGKTEYKDVSVSYGSEWNNFPIIRRLVSKHLLKKCNKKYREDKERFFKIISDNMESWWD